MEATDSPQQTQVLSRQGSVGATGSGGRQFVLARLSNPIGDNFCYLNSVVHMLSRCDAVRRVVRILAAAQEGCDSSLPKVDIPLPPVAAAMVTSVPGRLIDEEDAAISRITHCPVRVVADTMTEYDNTPVDGVASLRLLRAFISQVASTFRAGIMNDASEAMERLLTVLDIDATYHMMDRDTGSGGREHEAAPCCGRTHSTMSAEASTPGVAHSAADLAQRPIAALVAFSCLRQWRCVTARCDYSCIGDAAHVDNYMRVTHYVRRVYVYAMLYDDAAHDEATVPPEPPLASLPDSCGSDGNLDTAPRITHSAHERPFRQTRHADPFSFLVRSTESNERPFVCPGCGERPPEASMAVQWTLPSHHVLLHLVWHDHKPKPRELLRFYTHILTDTVCMGDLIVGDVGASVPAYQCACIHAIVLYKGNHYVSVVKHPTNSEWFLANDTKPVVRVALTWQELLRFLFRGQYVPLLLCGSVVPPQAAASATAVESQRPTEEYMCAAPPPSPAAVKKAIQTTTLQLSRRKELPTDGTQRTLDEWANATAPQKQKKVHDDDLGPRVLLTAASRKRGRSIDVDASHAVTDLTQDDKSPEQHDDTRRPSLGHAPASPSAAKSGNTDGDRAATGTPNQETVDFFLSHFRHAVDARAIEAVARDVTKTPDEKFEVLESMARRGASAAAATTPGRTSMRTIVDAAASCASFSVLQAARSTVEGRRTMQPRPFATAATGQVPPLANPLRGRTFVLLVVPTERKRHEQVVIGCGGVVQSWRDQRARVLDSYLLVDKRYVQHLSDMGALHTKEVVVGLLDAYKNALLNCEAFLDEVMRRKFPVATIISNHAIEYGVIARMIEHSAVKGTMIDDNLAKHATHNSTRRTTRAAPAATATDQAPEHTLTQSGNKKHTDEASLKRIVPESLAAAPLFHRQQQQVPPPPQSFPPRNTDRVSQNSSAFHSLSDDDDVEFVVLPP